MNIVYLIGNGFDLNLGMRTKYEHFYEYYLPICENDNILHIKNLKNTIEKEKDNWSDLESALGKYLNNDMGREDAVALHDHLIEHLPKYLASEEERYVIKEQRAAMNKYLIAPQNTLLPTEKAFIDAYFAGKKNESWDIKIITFNYTKSIERLLGNISLPLQISQHLGVNRSSSYANTLSAIEHIHGFVDERMVLGVNDTGQISNVALREETDVIDRYVKPSCNDTYGLGHDQICQQWIDRANLICLFGLSYGDTDKKWWEAIGRALIKGCKIIIFEYSDKKYNGNQGPALKAAKEEVKNKFLLKTNVRSFTTDISETESAKSIDHNRLKQENIFVAYNTDMFKLDVIQKEEQEKVKSE